MAFLCTNGDYPRFRCKNGMITYTMEGATMTVTIKVRNTKGMGVPIRIMQKLSPVTMNQTQSQTLKVNMSLAMTFLLF